MHFRSLFFVALALCGSAFGQMSDSLTSLDPGSRSMGAGTAFAFTDADTFSLYYNPAGLGFLKGEPRFGVSVRNLPGTRSRITGSLSNPTFRSSNRRGGTTISHLGYAVEVPAWKGVVGVSYTLGGHLDDRRTAGGSLPVDEGGTIAVNNYSASVKATTEFYTIGYSRANRAQTSSWGAGLVMANSRVEARERGTLNDGQNSPFAGADTKGSANGVGAIFGYTGSIGRDLNTSYGLSLRTPISLSGEGANSTGLPEIPLRVAGGLTYRKDAVRDGKDFLLVGVSAQVFAGGKRSAFFDRDGQTVLGVGAEYHLPRGSATIPIRMGFVASSSGGKNFDRRSAFTYGFGYRPGNGKFSVDLAFSAATGGANEVALTATGRF